MLQPVALLWLSLSAISSSQTVTPLSDVSWTLSSTQLNISVPASFPSQAHLDLYRSQVIGDPYYGLNDFNLRWVARSNWTYSAALQGLYVVNALEKRNDCLCIS